MSFELLKPGLSKSTRLWFRIVQGSRIKSHLSNVTLLIQLNYGKLSSQESANIFKVLVLLYLTWISKLTLGLNAKLSLACSCIYICVCAISVFVCICETWIIMSSQQCRFGTKHKIAEKVSLLNMHLRTEIFHEINFVQFLV